MGNEIMGGEEGGPHATITGTSAQILSLCFHTHLHPSPPHLPFSFLRPRTYSSQIAAVPPRCYHSGNLHVQRVLSCSLGAGHGTAGLLGGLVGAGKAGPRAAIDSEKE